MAINPGNRDYREWADAEAQEYGGRTSAVQAFGAAFSHTIDEDLSISRFLHNEDEDARNTQIKEMIGRGEISQDIELANTTWEPFVGYKVDYSAIAEYANENLGLKMLTDEELITSRNEMLANRRAERQDVIERSGGFGQAAAFGGGMVGSMVDPVGIAAGVATAGVGTGIMATSKALRSMSMTQSLVTQGLVDGAIGGTLSAAAVEPFIYSWKQEIGSPYTFGDAMFNVAASGLMGATLGGMVGGFKAKFGLRNIDDYDTNVNRFEELGASRAEAEGLARTLYDASRAPADMDPETYFREIEGRVSDMDNGTNQTRDTLIDATDEASVEAGFAERSEARREAGLEPDEFEAGVKAIESEGTKMEQTIRCLGGG